MNLAPVISVILFAQAPADVPKDHWAFPAVDALFKEGLLKGYPSGKLPPLKLDKSIKQDLKQSEKWLAVWAKKDIFDNSMGSCPLIGGRDPSNYELAVATYATLLKVESLFTDRKTSGERRREILSEFPTMAMALSMFSAELTKLGGDANEMIGRLNELYESPNRLFLGDRR